MITAITLSGKGMMPETNRISDILCLIMLAWFSAILIYKIQAAPFPLFLYSRKTFFLTLMVLIAGLAPFSFARPTLRMSLCAAMTAMNIFLLINQVLHPLLDVLQLRPQSLYMMEGIVLFTLLLGSHFLWKWLIRPGAVAASAAALLQAALAATTLAFLLKLESYPDATPYLPPAQPATLWAPVAFAGVAFLVDMYLYLRGVE